MCRLAAQADEAAAAETEAADAAVALRRAPRGGAAPVILDAATLAAAPRYTWHGRRRRVWQREGWPRGDGLRGLRPRGTTATAASGARASPGGVRARLRRGTVLQVGPAER
ncbi:MAG: hypothetical protein U0736_00165 [Gemmataceae bacterium]